MSTISKRSLQTTAALVFAGIITFGSSMTLSTLARSSNLQTFRQQALDAHNDYRQKHGAPPLVMDERLNNLAQNWANRMAATGQFQHRPNNKFGENLAYYENVKVDGRTPVQGWYDEIEFYDYNRPVFSEKTGHFTQLVWKSTRKVGCGVAQARGGRVYVACNYDPFGNMKGQFRQNVLSPR